MAPPTCRKVLLTAEPEPAFSRGSACMIATVTGGMMCAIPAPWRKKTTSIAQIGVEASKRAKAARPAATSSIAGGAHGLRAEAVHDEPRPGREHHLGDGERQDEQPGLQRAVAAHALQVEGGEEGHAHEGEEDERDRGDGRRERGLPEVRHVDGRVVAAPLVQDEEGEDAEAAEDRGEDGEVGEARQLAAADDPVHEEDESEDGEQHAGYVDPARLRVPGVGDQPHHEREGEEHDGHVDEEDRSPPEVFEQDAAGDRSDRDGEADAAGPDADGLGLLVPLEDVHEDGEGRGHDERGAEAHDGPVGDELARGAGEGGEGGADAEDGDAEEQHLLAAEAVAEQAGGEEEAA